MRKRSTGLAGVLLLALSGGAVLGQVHHAQAAGALSASWATTIHVGPNSGAQSKFSAEPLGGATVADLFGDGRKQLVVGFLDGSVSVLDGLTGNELPGWPRYTHAPMHTNPSVADLNHDGRQEIAAATEAGQVWVWNGDGSTVPGWPQHTTPPASDVSPAIFGGVAIGDLFGDGNQELVSASWDQHLYAWDSTGRLLPGFPIHGYDSAWDTPALVDLEHTGQLDIVVGFDSSGPPWDPWPSGGEMWAFRPTGCPGRYPDKTHCAIPGWPKTFDQVPWASPAAADLFNNGQIEIVSGTGFNFPDPRGHYVNAWTASGGSFGTWPKATTGRNLASPAVGDLFGNGQREVVNLSNNSLNAWDANGNALPGWPVSVQTYAANPTIGPISATQNGVWMINGATLVALDSGGHVVWTAGGLDWGGFAAPAIADLGTGQLSVVTLDQTTGGAFNSWTVRAFPIPGTSRMLPGAWPNFHGNPQLSGTLLPSATLSAMAPTQNTTATTVRWTLDANSVPASAYSLWVRDHGGGGWSIYGRTAATSMPFFGYPGHSYDLAIQAGQAEPNLSSGIVSTTFSPSAAWATPFKAMYAVDGHALLHSGSSAPITNSTSFPTWNIARGLALSTGGQGGYILDGFGGLHPFGNAPPPTTAAYWPNWDIARGIVLRADGHSGYVLDAFGGLHPFGTTGDVPPDVNASGYWPGWDIARDVQLRPDGQSGYVLDGWGGIHPFGSTNDMAPAVQSSGWWQGWDIAHRFALDSSGTGGYVLDGFGGLHQFGTSGHAPLGASVSAYWPGWDVARGVVMLPGSPTSGYVVDGNGGLHPFNGAPPVSVGIYTPGGIVNQLAIS